MTIYILTLFPQIFTQVFTESIIKGAQEKKLLEIKIINIRDFAQDKHKTVDDRPYGGGEGMVLKVDVVVSALKSIRPRPYTILLSASGEKFSQTLAQTFSKKKNLALVCGHYEGVDARVEQFVDKVISIGDFVLTGGEIAAMVVADAVIRLIPRVIKKESLESESFSQPSTFDSRFSTLLEHPQYTRPEQFRGLKVPKILLLGNHRKIADWRIKQAIERTKKYRPDLLKK
ncbi:tRNA (guanosine(37)-N1)-methyltransferase TrmD [Candidatus Curtissbacteria bacterium]|nr:tRNA (guanosine(37)-N1)-methyltransferase TrmD [Candidatus Curtissbacteria bacterium]